MYTRYHFPNQKPNEQILLFYRRHWITVVKIILFSAVLACVPIFLYIFLANTYADFNSPAFAGMYVLVNSAYALFIILFTFSNFIDYYLDVWIVTNMRIINIEQRGLFSRELSEKDLGRMQDISSEVKGFFATFLNYGDVQIQTAGVEQHFVFRQIPNAEEATRLISNLVAEYRKHNPELAMRVANEKESDDVE
jgi:uncharacterized membrane protein YdbT with pleckstrin-like domain